MRRHLCFNTDNHNSTAIHKNIVVYSRCYAMTASYATKQRPFLGNGSVNTFPRQQIRTQRVVRIIIIPFLAPIGAWGIHKTFRFTSFS
jgi:hypothetical protein